ncbi:MAG: aspartate kinase [Clostridia bacterium]|nr:aspartate kinase [Clostridia bacterium]
MNIIVQKYGGSSLKDKECLETVCENIIKAKENIDSLVVIVSAQGNTTNELISKAEEYTDLDSYSIDKKDLDFLLSTGEMQTAALLSLMLNSKGYDSVCLNGAQAGIITSSDYSNAKILNIIPDNIIYNLNEGKIVIVTGFQGVDRLGNITTLGRGGSDLSAVALSCALKAQKCEIYSDIDGIFTADPKIIPNAKLLNCLSYDEMIEATSNGAKVLHSRSVNMAKKYKLKIISKNTFSKSSGSLVQETSESLNVKMITQKKNLSKICLIGSMLNTNIDVITTIYNTAKEMGIHIYMISLNELSINIIVDTNIADKFSQELHNRLIKEE